MTWAEELSTYREDRQPTKEETDDTKAAAEAVDAKARIAWAQEEEIRRAG